MVDGKQQSPGPHEELAHYSDKVVSKWLTKLIGLSSRVHLKFMQTFQLFFPFEAGKHFVIWNLNHSYAVVLCVTDQFELAVFEERWSHPSVGICSRIKYIYIWTCYFPMRWNNISKTLEKTHKRRLCTDPKEWREQIFFLKKILFITLSHRSQKASQHR